MFFRLHLFCLSFAIQAHEPPSFFHAMLKPGRKIINGTLKVKFQTDQSSNPELVRTQIKNDLRKYGAYALRDCGKEKKNTALDVSES